MSLPAMSFAKEDSPAGGLGETRTFAAWVGVGSGETDDRDNDDPDDDEDDEAVPVSTIVEDVWLKTGGRGVDGSVD